MHCKQARRHIDCLPQPAQVSPELTQHIVQCSSCMTFLEERKALRKALTNLHTGTAALGPSTHVEQQVLAAFRSAAFYPRRTRHSLRWITVSALAVAVLFVATVFFHGNNSARKVTPATELAHQEAFTAMPYVVPPTPYERTTVIRTQVSVQIMQYAGFQVHDDSGATSLADVLYGEDGRILALRLVTSPNHA